MSIKNYSDETLFRLLIKLIFQGMRTGDFNIQHISDKISLSTSQLNRRVKAATGMSTSAFITKTRIDEAKRLLEKPYMHTVADVARMCGFADSSHFAHVFRRVEGMSPIQYANSLSGENYLSNFIKEQVRNAALEAETEAETGNAADASACFEADI